MRSLGTRWTLALIAVCLIEALLVAAAVRLTTQIGFERYVSEEAVQRFQVEVADYYVENGSLAGIGDAFSERRATYDAMRDSLEERMRSRLPERRTERQGGRNPGIRFGLADRGGFVAIPVSNRRIGDAVQPALLADGWSVVVGRDTIGTAFRPDEGFRPSRSHEAFLRASNMALGFALLGALLVAVLIGIAVSRLTTRPLRKLTDAAKAVAGGALGQTVDVRSKDEVGQLGEAFNAMSARLGQAHGLRKQMTADIAHDLRTPLSVLTGYLEAFREGALEATPERLEAMHDEAQHLGRLIDDLRTLALADAGEVTLHRTAVSAADMIERVARAFRAEANAAGVTLEVEVPEELPPLNADPDRLRQVLANLVQNAIRYTPVGGVVTLSARADLEGQALIVHDTGAGVPPDMLQHIFERTVRADPSREAEGSGSGLGLAIARSLVEAHGGTIRASNDIIQGATFVVVLPVAAEE